MSEIALIPFDEGQASSFDELTGAMPAFLNLLVEGPPTEKGRAVRTRPGIVTWGDFPSTPPVAAPVVAMQVFGDRVVYVTDDGLNTSTSRKVCAWTSAGNAIRLSYATGEYVKGSEPVTLVAGRNFAFAAGGSTLQVIDYTLATADMLTYGAAEAPTARDVAMIAQRVTTCRADLSGITDWSGIGDTEITLWDATFEFQEAEARPDPLVGIHALARELVMLGTRTTQVFIPNEQEVFSPGPVIELGTLSKRSVFRSDNFLAMLDHHGRLILSNLRTDEPLVLSDLGIARTVRELSVKSDCWGFRCIIGNHDLHVWVFPTAGRAFAFDKISQVWSEFRTWKNGRWQAWIPTSYLHWPERDLHLVGLADGTIAQLTLNSAADGENRLRFQARTGFRKVPRRRHTVEAEFCFRRGQAQDAKSSISITWRDNLGPFEEPLTEQFGTGQNAEDLEPTSVISPAGEPYKRRQWQIEGDSSDPLTLVSAVETFDEAEF